MPARYDNTIIFRYFGNVEKAQGLTTQGRKYMGVLLEMMLPNKLKYLAHDFRDEDGNVYRCISNQNGLVPINQCAIVAHGDIELDILTGFIVRLSAPNNNNIFMSLRVRCVEDDKKNEREGKTDSGYTFDTIDTAYHYGTDQHNYLALIDMDSVELPTAKDGRYYYYSYNELGLGDEVSPRECYSGTVSQSKSLNSLTFDAYGDGYGIAFEPTAALLNENGLWVIDTQSLSFEYNGTTYTYNQKTVKFTGSAAQNDGQYWASSLSKYYVDSVFIAYNCYLASSAYSVPPGYPHITTSEAESYFDGDGNRHVYIMPSHFKQRAVDNPKIRFVAGDYRYENGVVTLLDRVETKPEKQFAFAAVLPGIRNYAASDFAKSIAPFDSVIDGYGLIARPDAPKFPYLVPDSGEEKYALMFPEHDSAYFYVNYTETNAYHYDDWTMDSDSVSGTYEIDATAYSQYNTDSIDIEIDILCFGTKAANVYRYTEKMDGLFSNGTFYSKNKIVVEVGKEKQWRVGQPNPHIKIKANE